jgi:type III pantothenate kinase
MTRILVIDAGNSRMKWGCAVRTTAAARSDSQCRDRRAFASRLAGSAASRAAVGVNVAGESARSHRSSRARWRLTPEWLAASASACGVTNRYARPTQLGADRWASLVAAWRRSIKTDLFPPACVVVNAGTAVTIDALDVNGVFHVGLILPGIRLMLQTLAENTAGLKVPTGEFQAFPDNTADAIYSGSIQAICGAIEQMRRRIDSDPAHVRCYLAGGAAPEIATHLGPPVEVIDSLVLEGVLALAEEMK